MSTNTLVGGEPLYSISKSDYEALTARLAEAERLLREGSSPEPCADYDPDCWDCRAHRWLGDSADEVQK